jgi:hypothetical protein
MNIGAADFSRSVDLATALVRGTITAPEAAVRANRAALECAGVEATPNMCRNASRSAHPNGAGLGIDAQSAALIAPSLAPGAVFFVLEH